MKNFICFTLVMCSTFCFGQDHWINYTSNNKIFDIEVTDEGIWLGSEGGLGYFDITTGDEEYFNSGNSLIPSNRVVDVLYKAEDGDLWATTWQGICKINKSEMTVGPVISGPMRENLDGKIVVAGADNLYVQDEDMNFKTIEYPDLSVEINGLEVDQVTGAIYVNVINYFAESYLAEWLDGEWTILIEGFINESSMTLDKDNRLWYFHRDGLQYLEDGVWTLIPGTAEESPNFIPKLYVNNENEVVIAMTKYQECLELKVWNGVELVDLNYTNGDCSEFYFVGPAERESDLYYGSHTTKGLFRFRSDVIFDFMQLTQSPLIYNDVNNTLHLDDGSHIVIYKDKIHEIDAGNWTEISVPEDLDSDIQKGYLDEEDDLWIHSDNFLWELKDGEWTNMALPPEVNDKLNLMAVGENGDVWIQSKLNLARYRDGVWDVFNTMDHGLTSTIFRDMVVDPDNGDLWVSSFDGVQHFDGTTWQSYDTEPTSQFFDLALGLGGAFAIKNSQIFFLQNGVFESIPFPDEGEHNGFFSEIAYDATNDRLYLSGVLSLAIFENDEWTVHTSANSGLYSSGNNDIRVDNDENLWLSGSGGGLCVFNPEGITTLSIEEEDGKAFASDTKVYPTLLSDNFFFVESGKSGRYQVLVSDMSGRVIYNREHLMTQGLPERIILSKAENGLMFVSILSSDKVISRRVYSFRN